MTISSEKPSGMVEKLFKLLSNQPSVFFTNTYAAKMLDINPRRLTPIFSCVKAFIVANSDERNVTHAPMLKTQAIRYGHYSFPADYMETKAMYDSWYTNMRKIRKKELIKEKEVIVYKPKCVTEKIFQLLFENKDTFYTRGSIELALKLEHGSISSIFSRLFRFLKTKSNETDDLTLTCIDAKNKKWVRYGDDLPEPLRAQKLYNEWLTNKEYAKKQNKSKKGKCMKKVVTGHSTKPPEKQNRKTLVELVEEVTDTVLDYMGTSIFSGVSFKTKLPVGDKQIVVKVNITTG